MLDRGRRGGPERAHQNPKGHARPDSSRDPRHLQATQGSMSTINHHRGPPSPRLPVREDLASPPLESNDPQRPSPAHLCSLRWPRLVVGLAPTAAATWVSWEVIEEPASRRENGFGSVALRPQLIFDQA